MFRSTLFLVSLLVSSALLASDMIAVDITDRPSGKTFTLAVHPDEVGYFSFNNGKLNYAVRPSLTKFGFKIELLQAPRDALRLIAEGKKIMAEDLALLEVLKIVPSASTPLSKLGFSFSASKLSHSEAARKLAERRAQTLEYARAHNMNILVGQVISTKSERPRLCQARGCGSEFVVITPPETPPATVQCCVTCGETRACASCVWHDCGSCCDPKPTPEL